MLSKHGFKAPLSNRPLNRSRYDLSRFALSVKDEKPRLDGVKVERLYLTEVKALLGHSTDTVSLHIDSGADPHEVINERWNNHPFSQPAAIANSLSEEEKNILKKAKAAYEAVATIPCTGGMSVATTGTPARTGAASQAAARIGRTEIRRGID